MFAELFSIIAPVFVVAGVGYLWGRTGRAFETDFVTTLVTNVATPCLIFATLTRLETDAGAFGTMVLAGAAAIAGFGVVAFVGLKLAGLPVRAFLPPLMFPNGGNLGLPLALFAFGDEGLALAIAYFSLLAVLQFTVGVWIASGEAKLGRVLRVPVIYGVAAALAFNAAQVAPPLWLARTIDLLGGMAIPLLLLTLGVALARLRIAALPRAAALAVARLALGLGVGLGVSAAFGLPPVAAGVLTLQSAMPAAIFNYLFAQRYDNAPEEVAGVVLMSTALAFVTMPGLLLIVLGL